MRIQLVARCFLLVLLPLLTGCATMFRGTTETIRVQTTPAGQRVSYEQVEVGDDETVTVRKRFTPPRFSIGGEGERREVGLRITPDPWLLGDTALLIPFIIPGVIAFGVDFGTGAWRDLDDEQRVRVAGTRAAPEVVPPPPSAVPPNKPATPGSKTKVDPEKKPRNPAKTKPHPITP